MWQRTQETIEILFISPLWMIRAYKAMSFGFPICSRELFMDDQAYKAMTFELHICPKESFMGGQGI